MIGGAGFVFCVIVKATVKFHNMIVKYIKIQEKTFALKYLFGIIHLQHRSIFPLCEVTSHPLSSHVACGATKPLKQRRL